MKCSILPQMKYFPLNMYKTSKLFKKKKNAGGMFPFTV